MVVVEKAGGGRRRESHGVWLMTANVVSGTLMWAVHLLAKNIPSSEYGLFGAYFSLAMIIPGMPLQATMAHQTAQALASNQLGTLASKIRFVWRTTFLIWICGAVALFLFQIQIQAQWGITNIAGLYVTAVALLFTLWLPVFSGILQGEQDFTCIGWTMIINGVGRLGIAAMAVLVFGAFAVGMMAGVLAGLSLAVALSIWSTRSLWDIPAETFEWRVLARQVVPPTLGFGAFIFIATADTIFVRAMYQGSESGFYLSAGTLSRALLWFVAPLAAIMFARVAYNSAIGESHHSLRSTFVATGVLISGGVVGLSVFGAQIVESIWGAEYVPMAKDVLPWYAAAMIPLALANVLLSFLIAKSDFRIVIPLVLLAIIYGCALAFGNHSVAGVPKVLFYFCFMLLVLCSYFVVRPRIS